VLGSYYWRQAQVCMSLARTSDDPAQKQRYEDLALEFAQSAADRRDFDSTIPPSFVCFTSFEIVPGARQFESRCTEK
jgi:hypothetical protein